MLRAYKSSHEKSKLKAVAFEVAIDTPEFYGIVDVVLEDEKGWWFIADVKTAASYNPAILPTLPMHPQLNLYAKHFSELAEIVGLDPKKYGGCRYRMVTKSKLVRKEGEELAEFLQRLGKTVKSFDILLSGMAPDNVYEVLKSAKEFIDNNKGDESKFFRNYGSCFSYYRPCPYFSRCHSSQYTKMADPKIVSSEV
jgi:hypothetical protein